MSRLQPASIVKVLFKVSRSTYAKLQVRAVNFVELSRPTKTNTGKQEKGNQIVNLIYEKQLDLGATFFPATPM